MHENTNLKKDFYVITNEIIDFYLFKNYLNNQNELLFKKLIKKFSSHSNQLRILEVVRIDCIFAKG